MTSLRVTRHAVSRFRERADVRWVRSDILALIRENVEPAVGYGVLESLADGTRGCPLTANGVPLMAVVGTDNLGGELAVVTVHRRAA